MSAYADNTFLLDFTGHDWLQWGEMGEPGSCYTAVGFVPAVNSTYLNFNYATNEYTFILDYPCYASADTFGVQAVWNYSGVGTRFDAFCDPIAGGTAADYGSNPPNLTSPSTFVDGTNVIGGDFQNPGLFFVVDINTRNGNVQAFVDLNRGTQLGNIPVSSRTMALSLAGVREDGAQVQLPDGYFWQIDGEIYIESPTPTEVVSWGKLKNIAGEED
jgi:hypothetical protein